MGKDAEKGGGKAAAAGPHLDADTLKGVLREVEQERRENHQAAARHNAAVAEFGEAWEDESSALTLAVNEARGALNAFEKRLKGRMPEADLREQRAPLEKALKAAERAQGKAQARRKAEAVRLNAEGRKVNARAQELGAEWRQLCRLAEALGADTSAYWTPEKAQPDDADDGEAGPWGGA